MLYKRLMGGQAMRRDDLIAGYERSWERKWHEGVRIVKKEIRAYTR